MRLFIKLVIILLFSNWAYAGVVRTEVGLRWQASELIGYRYELVDNETVEQYWFAEGGLVSLTVGKKNGPLMAPLLYWRIDKRGVLIISGAPGKTGDSFVKIRSNADEVIVDLSSVRKVYRRTKN